MPLLRPMLERFVNLSKWPAIRKVITIVGKQRVEEITPENRVAAGASEDDAKELLAAATAQNVDPKLLLNPPADSWLNYHGDYTGQRHSKLTQITPENVGRLKQLWRYQAPSQLKASPIVAGGMIYITAPDHLWALDALVETFPGTTLDATRWTLQKSGWGTLADLEAIAALELANAPFDLLFQGLQGKQWHRRGHAIECYRSMTGNG